MYSPHMLLRTVSRRLLISVSLVCALAIALPAGAGTPVACDVLDDGSGTGDLPPVGCEYVSLSPMMIIDGLPPGTTMQCDLNYSSFFDITYAAGGTLGGGRELFHGQAHLNLLGTGSMAGYFRTAFFDVFCEVHEAPRGGNPQVQTFDTDMFYMQGQMTGDPDFDLLRITAGAGFGLPSPGHTTLTRTTTGAWAVDSFFDITYRIDFVGAPGGAVAGMSGSTTGTVRLQAGLTTPVAAEVGTWGGIKALYR